VAERTWETTIPAIEELRAFCFYTDSKKRPPHHSEVVPRTVANLSDADSFRVRKDRSSRQGGLFASQGSGDGPSLVKVSAITENAVSTAEDRQQGIQQPVGHFYAGGNQQAVEGVVTFYERGGSPTRVYTQMKMKSELGPSEIVKVAEDGHEYLRKEGLSGIMVVYATTIETDHPNTEHVTSEKLPADTVVVMTEGLREMLKGFGVSALDYHVNRAKGEKKRSGSDASLKGGEATKRAQR